MLEYFVEISVVDFVVVDVVNAVVVRVVVVVDVVVVVTDFVCSWEFSKIIQDLLKDFMKI